MLVLNNNNAVSPNVLYDAKGQLANDKINLINAKNTLETSKLSLIQLLNIDNMIKIKRNVNVYIRKKKYIYVFF